MQERLHEDRATGSSAFIQETDAEIFPGCCARAGKGRARSIEQKARRVNYSSVAVSSSSPATHFPLLPRRLINQLAVLMSKALSALLHRQLRAKHETRTQYFWPGQRWSASSGAVSVAIGTRGEKVTTQMFDSRTSSAT